MPQKMDLLNAMQNASLFRGQEAFFFEIRDHQVNSYELAWTLYNY